MAEDNVSSNLALLYELDENTNPLNPTNILHCTAEREDNHNIFLTNSHALSIIQKLTEFKQQSTKVSYSYRNFNQPENCSFKEKNVCFQTCSNYMSSKSLLNKSDASGGVTSLNNFNKKPANSLPAGIHYQDDLSNEHHSSALPDCRKAELFTDSLQKQTYLKSEDIKKTLNSASLIENHSEAGPDVAEFSEEELRSVAELLKEPSAFDFFQKASNSKLLRESPLGRLSLFVKLDAAYKNNSEGSQEKSAQDSGLDISGDSNSLNAACGNEKEYDGPLSSSVMTSENTNSHLEQSVLIDIDAAFIKKMDKTSSSLHQQSSHCEHKLFTEEEFTQALKMQELLFHEKQLKRDKDRGDQVKVVEREKQLLKNQIVALSRSSRASRGILEELLNIFTVWLTAKEQEHVEMASNNQKAIKERDQALEDLQNVESAFADLHRRYENCKSVLEGYKQNEDRIKQQVLEMQMKVKQQEQMYEMLSR